MDGLLFFSTRECAILFDFVPIMRSDFFDQFLSLNCNASTCINRFESMGFRVRARQGRFRNANNNHFHDFYEISLPLALYCALRIKKSPSAATGGCIYLLCNLCHFSRFSKLQKSRQLSAARSLCMGWINQPRSRKHSKMPLLFSLSLRADVYTQTNRECRAFGIDRKHRQIKIFLIAAKLWDFL